MDVFWKFCFMIALCYLHCLLVRGDITEEDASITTESPEDRLIKEFIEGVKTLQTNRKQLQIDKNKLRSDKRKLQKQIKMSDVLQLNVGGEIVMTTRASLTRVSSSVLAILLNGRWEHKFNHDNEDILFLDFDPTLFRHLLDQLRGLKNTKTPVFSPPHSSAPHLRQPFDRMLKKLRLNSSPSSSNDTVVLNVGGQPILTSRRRLTASKLATLLSRSATKLVGSNLKEAFVFVDADPKLFRHIVEQLREEQWMQSIYFKSPSTEHYKPFNAMLKTLGFRPRLTGTAKWKQNGLTIGGTGSSGSGLNQFYSPYAFHLDDDRTIYVADYSNHRIVSWQKNSTTGTLVIGGTGSGSRLDQLYSPSVVITDRKNGSLIVSEIGNRRITQWPRDGKANGSVILSGVESYGLAMDNDGYLYVSICGKNEVRKYGPGDTNGTVVAGGNGQGSASNQLYCPWGIFIDEDHAIYVTDVNNHRVMKWMKSSREGVLVAGGRGYGSGYTQLYNPRAAVVDSIGSVYVADNSNHRVTRWLKDAKEGSTVVGGNGAGSQSNQLYSPYDLSLDSEGNLYVVDLSNHRIQQFLVEKY